MQIILHDLALGRNSVDARTRWPVLAPRPEALDRVGRALGEDLDRSSAGCATDHAELLVVWRATAPHALDAPADGDAHAQVVAARALRGWPRWRRLVVAAHATLLTLAACGPLSLWAISNSTS